MPLLWKILRGVRLSSDAIYSLYFDAFRPDPYGLAKNARERIRTVYFETHGNRKIPTVPLEEWFSTLSANSNHGCSDLVLPAGLLETGGVGSITYFYVLAAICSRIKPRQIVEFGTFLGAGTLAMALNCNARILTIDLPNEVTKADISTLNEVEKGLSQIGKTGRDLYISRIRQ